METADDRALWEFAKSNGFTIVSQDSDFADMAAVFGPPPKVIWLRCGNQTNDVIEKLFRDHAGAIIAFGNDVDATCWEIY